MEEKYLLTTTGRAFNKREKKEGKIKSNIFKTKELM